MKPTGNRRPRPQRTSGASDRCSSPHHHEEQRGHENSGDAGGDPPIGFGCLEWKTSAATRERSAMSAEATGRSARCRLRGLQGSSLVAISISPHQHGDSQIAVIESDEHHCHPRDGDHGLVARHAAQAGKRHKPDRSPDKEHGKEKEAQQPRCPTPPPGRRQPQTEGRDSTRSVSPTPPLRDAAFLRLADVHQL